METKYRIREQYGLFFIEYEEKIIINNYEEGFFKNKLVSLEAKVYWETVKDYKLISKETTFAPNKEFKTIEEARKYIINLEPKYHDI